MLYEGKYTVKSILSSVKEQFPDAEIPVVGEARIIIGGLRGFTSEDQVINITKGTTSIKIVFKDFEQDIEVKPIPEEPEAVDPVVSE